MKSFQDVLRWRTAFTKTALLLILLVTGTMGFAQMPDPPGQVKSGESPRNEAYLFAHMMDGDYWRLYYSVSLDGLHWTLLNGGKRVFEDYRGHADICRGPDKRYYLVGNRGDDQPGGGFRKGGEILGCNVGIPDLDG